MNIEELDILKELSEQKYFGDLLFSYYADLIGKLLTAYEKEKEKNVKLRLQDIPLIEGELKAYKDRVDELKTELEKEKEKNKELIKQHAIEITDVGGNSIKIDLDGKIHNVYKIEEEKNNVK